MKNWFHVSENVTFPAEKGAPGLSYKKSEKACWSHHSFERDGTTMNSDLVAAQLEEFRAALAEVNANVRLLPLSPWSSPPRFPR